MEDEVLDWMQGSDDPQDFPEAAAPAETGDEVEASNAAEALEEAARVAAQPPDQDRAFIVTEVVDGSGYVRCEQAPWVEQRYLGRLAVWPWHEVPAKQRVTCTCYMHRKCSIIRPRLQVRDEVYVKWLLSGIPENAADVRGLHTTAASHKAAFQGILNSSVEAPTAG